MDLQKLGKYEIVSKLGAGAMGEVWKAKDPVLNRFVAVKVMSANLEADSELIARFQREAQSAARLNHPNIITVFDFGQEQGKLFMAMELLEGTDLKEAIAQKSLPELWDRILVMEQICDGLAFAHARGIVHRDVKPANVHILPNGRVKIMDFGLARIEASEMTHQGMVMGTPNYMSPEQVRGLKADPRSDVFAAGALFYELLSGRKAFSGDTMHAILNQVLDGEPDPLKAIAPGMPVELIEIVEKAICKQPDQRYPDARDLLQAVKSVRERMDRGEIASGVFDAESTLNSLEAPTAISLGSSAGSIRAARTIAGATALDPSRQIRPDRSRRSAPTLSGQEQTQLGDAAPASKLPWIGAGVLVAAGAAALYFALQRPAPPPSTLAAAEVAREQVGVLTESLVSSQVELARVSLEDKDYAAALKAAQQALKLDPASGEAKEVLGLAQKTLTELDEAAKQAKAAFGKGDTAGAATALATVLRIDPRHPVAAELSSALNQHFRSQAEEARKAMADSRAAAVNATAQEAHGKATILAKGAEGLFQSKEYAVAASKFLEARDGFDRAQRALDVAQAAAQAQQQAQAEAAARQAAQAQQAAATRPSAPPSQAASRSVAPPLTAPPVTAAAAVITPVVTAPPVTVNPVAGHESAVRKLIADYAAALEGKDLAAFRSVKPNLSGDEEKRLSTSFKAIKSWKVGIEIENMALEGAQIKVRVQRQDNVNGRATPKVAQNFTLVQQAGGWKIESIGQ